MLQNIWYTSSVIGSFLVPAFVFVDSLQLMVDVDNSVLQIDVLDGQPAEFADSHSCMEEDVEYSLDVLIDISPIACILFSEPFS